MYKIGEDEIVFCPYNRFHLVSKLRIQKHIVKCQKNYPDVKLATCFYNYTHRLRPEDLLKHYEICSHKTRIDGSRYSEPYCLTSSNASVKSDSCSDAFPDINVKPRVLKEPGKLYSSSGEAHCDGDSDSSCSEGGTDYPELICGDIDDDDDDDLEPLPLPKTISKAFVCDNQEPRKFIPHTSTPRGFGRGKSFLLYSPTEKPKTSSSVPSDNLTMESSKVEHGRSGKEDRNVLFQKGDRSLSSSILKYKVNSSCKSLPKDCSASITSSMFEDVSTLKSVDSISDVESSEEDNANDGFIFTHFDKYVKI